MCLLTEYCPDEFWYTKPMTVTRICSIAIANKWPKTRRQTFVFRPKQGNKIESVLLNRAWILGIFCPKQGQGFKASAAHLYPNICLVLPPPPPTVISKKKNIISIDDTLFDARPTTKNYHKALLLSFYYFMSFVRMAYKYLHFLSARLLDTRAWIVGTLREIKQAKQK